LPARAESLITADCLQTRHYSIGREVYGTSAGNGT
jgi:hypothetical protein